jgi:hypothetical protein
MQAAATVAATPKSIICPITMEIMTDPVVVVNGDTFERNAIEKWFTNNITLPTTNETITDTSVYPNTALKLYIQWWVAQNPQPVPSLMNEFIPQIKQKPAPRPDSPRYLSAEFAGFLSNAHRVLSSSSVRGFGSNTLIEFSLSRRQPSSRIVPFDG